MNNIFNVINGMSIHGLLVILVILTIIILVLDKFSLRSLIGLVISWIVITLLARYFLGIKLPSIVELVRYVVNLIKTSLL